MQSPEAEVGRPSQSYALEVAGFLILILSTNTQHSMQTHFSTQSFGLCCFLCQG